MVDLTLETFGRLDILVNNAGIQHVAPIDQFPVEKWDQVIAIDLSSAFHATRLAVPAMRKTGWGRIVNVASLAGHVSGTAGHTLYGASKAYMIKFSQSLALENRHRAVTMVHLACTGAEVVEGLFAEMDAREQFDKPNSTKVPAQLDQLANLLCRGPASRTQAATLLARRIFRPTPLQSKCRCSRRLCRVQAG